MRVDECVDYITLAQADYGLQDTLSEGSNGVLNAGSQAKCVLEVRLLYQQLPVWSKLWCSGQQGSDTVHKLWYEAGVGVISLTKVVGYHLIGDIKKVKNAQNKSCNSNSAESINSGRSLNCIGP